MVSEDARINIGVNGQAVSDALAKIGKDMDTMANSLTGRLARIGGAWGAIAPVISGVGAVANEAWEGLKGSVTAAGEREQVQLRFGRLLLDPAAGEEFVEQLTELAARTPLEMGEIFDAGAAIVSRTPLRGEEALDFLRRAGDLAVSANISLAQMVDTLAKPFQRGGLSNEVVEMLENANVAFKKTLAEAEGISEMEVFENISKKRYGVDEYVAVLTQLTDEGSQAFGMMAAQAETFDGKMSTLQDTFGELQVTLGQAVLPALTDVVGEASLALESMAPLFEAVGDALSEIVGFAGGEVLGSVTDQTVGFTDAMVDGVLATVDAVSVLAEAFSDVWDVVSPLAGLLLDVGGGVMRWVGNIRAVLWDVAKLKLGADDGAVMTRIRDQRQAELDETISEVNRVNARTARKKRQEERAAARQKAQEEKEWKELERRIVGPQEGPRRRSLAELTTERKALDEEKARREEEERRRKNWSNAESERRTRLRLEGLRMMPYEQRSHALEANMRAAGLAGTVSDESITAKINELMKADPVGHEHEIAELKRMRELWSELVEQRREYEKQAMGDNADLVARALEATRQHEQAFELREVEAARRRSAELQDAGATAAEAANRAALESALRRAERMQQHARPVEFVQQDGAHLGSGATSIRLGDMQLAEARRGNKYLEDIYSFLRYNQGSVSSSPYAVLA